jgi:hypothetical protein
MGFPEDIDPALRDFYADDDVLYKYVRAMASEMPPGTNIVGAIAQRRRALLMVLGEGSLDDLADRLTYAPGDRVLNFGGNEDPDLSSRIGLGVPIAYDIWYLWPAGNVLEFGGKSIEESMEKMVHYFSSVDNAKPMRSPSGGPSTATISCEDFVYTIKEARFEIYLEGNGSAFDSVGPSISKNDMAGYIAVPIGPFGVMWRMSLGTESSLSDGSSANVKPSSSDNHTTQGGELLPPFDFSIRETCGEMMIDKGYVLDDESTCELLADGFDDDPPKHKWLRYWIKSDNTAIIPGEFVGILCRPWPLHCWWKQETAPFVYAGNWIETEFYTSGVVKQIWEEDEYTPESNEVGRRYKVWVKNEELIVKSSDFLEYEINERVGLLKTYRDGNGGPSYGGDMTPAGPGGGTTNFSWQELELQNTGEALNKEWTIVPVDFYGTGGNKVGGA